jgi:hypothetical protein
MLRTQYGSEQINERASAAFQVPASIAPLSWLTLPATPQAASLPPLYAAVSMWISDRRRQFDHGHRQRLPPFSWPDSAKHPPCRAAYHAIGCVQGRPRRVLYRFHSTSSAPAIPPLRLKGVAGRGCRIRQGRGLNLGLEARTVHKPKSPQLRHCAAPARAARCANFSSPSITNLSLAAPPTPANFPHWLGRLHAS